MDSHSPGMGEQWNTSEVEECRTSPNSSLASSFALDCFVTSSPDNVHAHMSDYSSSHQFDLSTQMIETKRSYSMCALSLTSSSEADLSSGYFERRSYRPFRSNEEYLVAMREDLAEWLNTLYSGLKLNSDNFLMQLENGVILCRHANSVLNKIRFWCDSEHSSPFKQFHLDELDLHRDVVFRATAQPGTFQARDNVANFINWCRRIRIHECLLFETEDLVMRKNEKSFVLCLLEVARYGAKFGVLAPTLVQFEQEIDRELAKEKEQENCSSADCEGESVDSGVVTPEQQPEGGLFSDEQPELVLPYGPQPQISNNDLESLHEKVVKLLSKCTCPVQFHLEHLSEGKYRIGDTKTLIFVRILRNHVMVRVGGGWDTLEHYLEKHDPCRCGRLAPQRNFASISSTTTMRATSSSHLKNETNATPSYSSHILDQQRSQQQKQTAVRCIQRSVYSSPIPSRKDIQSGTINGYESLSSSPSEVPSSLGSSQNSITSNSSTTSTNINPSKPDRNNNNIKNQKRTSGANCKRRSETRIPKFGKPPSGTPKSTGLLPCKTKSTSSLALGSKSSQSFKGNSRIPSLSSCSINGSSLQVSNTPERYLSSRQKQRSTIELRTPTPPNYPSQTAFSTSSLHRRNQSFGNSKSFTTPLLDMKSPSPITVNTYQRNLCSVSKQVTVTSSPNLSRKELTKKGPHIGTVPPELCRKSNDACSFDDTSSSSNTFRSLTSLNKSLVPKSDYRSVSINRVTSPNSKKIQPKNTALVNVSSWLERNQLTS